MAGGSGNLDNGQNIRLQINELELSDPNETQGPTSLQKSLIGQQVMNSHQSSNVESQNFAQYYMNYQPECQTSKNSVPQSILNVESNKMLDRLAQPSSEFRGKFFVQYSGISGTNKESDPRLDPPSNGISPMNINKINNIFAMERHSRDRSVKSNK